MQADWCRTDLFRQNFLTTADDRHQTYAQLAYADAAQRLDYTIVSFLWDIIHRLSKNIFICWHGNGFVALEVSNKQKTPWPLMVQLSPEQVDRSFTGERSRDVNHSWLYSVQHGNTNTTTSCAWCNIERLIPCPIITLSLVEILKTPISYSKAQPRLEHGLSVGWLRYSLVARVEAVHKRNNGICFLEPIVERSN